jgi:hypothetical protein
MGNVYSQKNEEMWEDPEVVRKTRLYFSEHRNGLRVPNCLILRRVILLYINMHFRCWITLLFCCEVCHKFKWKTLLAIISVLQIRPIIVMLIINVSF